MNLDEARELRTELEAIEATMQRIKTLWAEMPSEDDLNDLVKAVGTIETTMNSIIEKAEDLPTADSLQG